MVNRLSDEELAKLILVKVAERIPDRPDFFRIKREGTPKYCVSVESPFGQLQAIYDPYPFTFFLDKR